MEVVFLLPLFVFPFQVGQTLLLTINEGLGLGLVDGGHVVVLLALLELRGFHEELVELGRVALKQV